MLLPLLHSPVAAADALLPVNLAAVDAAHLVRILAPLPAQLLVDCGTLSCQRTQGICFLVSQLLVLHQSGSRVWLRNASPVLQRSLQQLKLTSLFTLVS